mmetsp:Transcript_91461/g.282915  ORF Transcript_91461/g.282915 Transcript_91461/m.282915 type:complete len:263 (-) Transcript_91461:78-866(-)
MFEWTEWLGCPAGLTRWGLHAAQPQSFRVCALASRSSTSAARVNRPSRFLKLRSVNAVDIGLGEVGGEPALRSCMRVVSCWSNSPLSVSPASCRLLLICSMTSSCWSGLMPALLLLILSAINGLEEPTVLHLLGSSRSPELPNWEPAPLALICWDILEVSKLSEYTEEPFLGVRVEAADFIIQELPVSEPGGTRGEEGRSCAGAVTRRELGESVWCDCRFPGYMLRAAPVSLAGAVARRSGSAIFPGCSLSVCCGCGCCCRC